MVAVQFHNFMFNFAVWHQFVFLWPFISVGHIIAIHPLPYQLKHGIYVFHGTSTGQRCAKTLAKPVNYLLHFAVNNSLQNQSKWRFCGGRVRESGGPHTQSSPSLCSCHGPQPARLHFANWNARPLIRAS